MLSVRHILKLQDEQRLDIQFLVDYADVERTRVAGGYNPLLEDFSNTRFL